MLGKRSTIGVVSLIIFIALLLVGAIAAFVLIQTQLQVEETSLATATRARREVTTQVELFELTGTDGRDGELDHFRYNVRLKPGAEPIKLQNTVLYLSTYNDTLRLIYKEGDCRRDVTNGFYTYR